MSKAGATGTAGEISAQTRRISGLVEPEPELQGRAAVSVSNRAWNGHNRPNSWRHGVCVLFWPECAPATISEETSPFDALAPLRRASSGHRFRNRHRTLIYRDARDE